MAHVRIISIENPHPESVNVTCEHYRHSKWVIRRKYVEATLLPQMQRMGFESAELFKAITDPDYVPLLTRDLYGKAINVAWLGHTIPIGSDGTPCLLSHFTLWKMCVDQGITLFIFEDDALLDPANEEMVFKAVREYESGPYNADVLYLQLAVPYHQTALKSYDKHNSIRLSPVLTRVIHTGDMAGSAAYVVRPGSAHALMQRAIAHGTAGADAMMHRALDNKEIGVLIMTEYQRGFMLNDHWSEWNHIHNPR